MTSVARASLSTSAKFVAAALALVGVVHLVDFVFYGQRLDHLLAGAGFSLMAFGTFKNGFVTEENSLLGRYAAGLGAILAIASVVLESAR